MSISLCGARSRVCGPISMVARDWASVRTASPVATGKFGSAASQFAAPAARNQTFPERRLRQPTRVGAKGDEGGGAECAGGIGAILDDPAGAAIGARTKAAASA